MSSVESRRGKPHRKGPKSAGTETTTTSSTTSAKSAKKKEKPDKPEFKQGDSVVFYICTTEESEFSPKIAIADGIYKKQKFDLASLSAFVNVDSDVINERLEHALKFPCLRPLPLDAEARSHPYVVDGRHLKLMDDCTIPRMISRRRAMVLQKFVIRQKNESTDIVKEPTIEKAIKKLKAQIQSLLKTGEKNPSLGLYRCSSEFL